MSTLDSAPPAHWQFYAERAHQAHYGRLDDFGYGREELLWELLAIIESGIPFTDVCQQRLDRIPRNRAKKYRRLRRRLLAIASPAIAHEVFAVDVSDSVSQVRNLMSADEWVVECRLAAGDTYAQIALDYGIFPHALKMRAARWRARVRHKLGTCV